MAWDKCLQLLIGSQIIVAQTLAPEAPASVNADEIRSYSCAHSLVSIVQGVSQPGPIFAEGSLVFTSVDAADGGKILVASAGRGTYALALEGSGVNRIRFELPTSRVGVKQTFFLSYLHGETLRARYFEFSTGTPPFGKDLLDYVLVNPRRAQQLNRHLEYAIRETADNIVGRIMDGRLSSDSYRSHPVSGCNYIYQNSPKMARILRRRVDELEMLVSGPRIEAPAGRMPASVSWRR